MNTCLRLLFEHNVLQYDLQINYVVNGNTLDNK